MTRIAVLLASLACAASGVAEEPPVSFANDVAPILVGQCLVCHNARTAKGRFNLATYASLMKGGESGPAVSVADGDLSNLIILIDSGEMPKDGDPLPAEQIALLKRWVAQGAALDAGKRADQPLAAIMPKPPQPLPPDVYPAPVPVTALAFSPDGAILAVSGYHEVLLFDPSDGRLLRRIQKIAERVDAVAFSPNGRLLAVAAGTPARLGEVQLFDVSTGERVADLASAGDAFFDVAFSPDGTQLAACGADGTVRLWNVADRTQLARIEDHADWVTAIAFSPDGRRLATASRDKTAKVFDLATHESVATFTGHEDAVADVLFTPDGQQVVSCGKDGQIRLWNVADAKQKRSERLKGEALVLAPCGDESFLCGSGDRTARLFGYDAKRKTTFGDQPGWVFAVAATRDGTTIALGSSDGTVTLRKANGDDVLRAFPAMPPKP